MHYLADGWRQELMTFDDFLDKHVLAAADQSGRATSDPAEPTGSREEAPEAGSLAKGSDVSALDNNNNNNTGYLAQHSLFDQVLCCLQSGLVHSVCLCV